MKPYILRKMGNEKYTALVVGTVHESPLSYLNEIEKDLKNSGIHGDILIDCLLHNGNSRERFIKIRYDQKLDLNSTSIVDLKRDDALRQYSCCVLAEHPEIIANSILNKFQKDLLNNKVTL